MPASECEEWMIAISSTLKTSCLPALFLCYRFSIQSLLLRFLAYYNTEAFVSLTVTVDAFCLGLYLSGRNYCIHMIGCLLEGDFSILPESMHVRLFTVAADYITWVPGLWSTSFSRDTLLDSARRYFLRMRLLLNWGVGDRDSVLVKGLAVSTSEWEKPTSWFGSICWSPWHVIQWREPICCFDSIGTSGIVLYFFWSTSLPDLILFRDSFTFYRTSESL